MSSILLQVADYLLFAIHIAAIVINLFGWLFKKTRKLQLITIIATTFSWFVMGVWYGWGYCFLTDWEWEIKRDLGEYGLPKSFVHYLANNTFNLNISTKFLDDLTIATFAIALVASVIVNYRDFKMEKEVPK